MNDQEIQKVPKPLKPLLQGRINVTIILRLVTFGPVTAIWQVPTGIELTSFQKPSQKIQMLPSRT